MHERLTQNHHSIAVCSIILVTFICLQNLEMIETSEKEARHIKVLKKTHKGDVEIDDDDMSSLSVSKNDDSIWGQTKLVHPCF